MANIKTKNKIENRKLISPFKNYWTKKNLMIFYLGILTLLVGFFLMSIGPWNNPLSLSVSPIILLIAYVIVFPLSILKSKSKS
ncbi:MAG: hypothetical protein HYS24_05800 [Ignavibacteriales bacterium]|nr:hypothetical protein [Ignavibacteriales bacterium]